MSAAATRLYGAIARQEFDTAEQIQAEHPHARAELVAWGLISGDGDTPVACDPKKAIQHRLEVELAEVTRRVAIMSTMPGLAGELNAVYQAGQLRAGNGSSVFLDDKDAVNARLQTIVTHARHEILAAQPGGPRSRDLFDIAVARDTEALDRGVALRTIYRDTVRDHKVTAEYARTMSTRTQGRCAQYRTLVGGFERMIIVDREYAVVSNHIVHGAPDHAAWLIVDPAAVAVLAKVFEAKWLRAQPWLGELRPKWGGLEREPVGPDGVRTNRLEREVMRLLCSGAAQTSVAAKLGISKRKLEEVIAALKGLWGVRTLNELIYQFALSPDRLVDDSAPEAGPAGAESTAA
ncbi:hypothetical protein ABZX39_33670 [Streptomyces collinus]|uniref:hypothetical protein n=1 Tax=Streptomyces collinus TaxID=42684 RepID=UPI00339E7B9E